MVPMTLKKICHFSINGHLRGLAFNIREKYIITPQVYWIGSGTSNIVDSGDRNKVYYTHSYTLFDVHGELKLSEQLSHFADIVSGHLKM